jgi:RNA polymerase sigma-70 factor (ECF subfamily)
MTETDAALVARVRQGDATAFDVLMRRHFRAAYVVALANVGNPADAEDVCQDAFLRCWERIEECREPSRFAAWMLRVVRNQAHNRREYLAVRAAEPLEQHGGYSSSLRTDARTELTELRAVLLAALRELSATQREVVLLHDLEGWRHSAIATHLEISEVMSRRHLSDARKRLRVLLGEYNTLEPDHD